ncbi:MAG: hypothetical protein FJY85_00935 [Deltaproteobacteria bacterium]|nr:hypothetical protein [Deltaproteobacteria bacterium]
MVSRYLPGFDLESIFDFRQTVILDGFNFFQPDALIVEHNMTGQMSELIPVLMKKWMRKGGPVDFPLVHICRGIMRWIPLLRIPYQNPRHRSESINLGALYDFMYVLEDREVIDINKAFLGDDPELEKKIRYLGKITNRVHGEFPPRAEVMERLGLPDRKIVLVSLGRNQNVVALSTKLLETFQAGGVFQTHQVVVVLDPYLDKDRVNMLRDNPMNRQVRFLDFFQNMADLINQSELVVSRAGYNIVNEILLTGVKAVLIPESHGGGEQEFRAKTVHGQNIHVFTEQELLNGDSCGLILDHLAQPIPSNPHDLNKYAVGKVIIEDLENWKLQALRRGA